jgi:hypothetical protein
MVLEVFYFTSSFATADRNKTSNPQRFIHVVIVHKLKTEMYENKYERKTT